MSDTNLLQLQHSKFSKFLPYLLLFPYSSSISTNYKLHKNHWASKLASFLKKITKMWLKMSLSKQHQTPYLASSIHCVTSLEIGVSILPLFAARGSAGSWSINCSSNTAIPRDCSLLNTALLPMFDTSTFNWLLSLYSISWKGTCQRCYMNS